MSCFTRSVQLVSQVFRCLEIHRRLLEELILLSVDLVVPQLVLLDRHLELLRIAILGFAVKVHAVLMNHLSLNVLHEFHAALPPIDFVYLVLLPLSTAVLWLSIIESRAESFLVEGARKWVHKLTIDSFADCMQVLDRLGQLG